MTASSPMASTPPANADSVTTCPTCGATIRRRGMSLCAYCAAPLGVAKADVEEGGEDPDLARIAKVGAHETYEQEMAKAPPEGLEWHRACDQQRRGAMLMGVGLVVRLLSMLLPAPGWDGTFFLVTVFIVLLGLVTYLSARKRIGKITGQHLLARPAKVTDRRSETSLDAGATSYFFTLKFEDGNTTEVRRPGRGIAEEVYPTGSCGLAFTRGDELLEFRRFRV